jgi:CHAD domain-containing protein
MMNAESALREIATARAAVEAAISSSNDPITANQLEMAREALGRMRDSLVAGVSINGYSQWLSQMVADQWDPKANLTEAVLRADRAYAEATAHATPAKPAG